MRYDPIKELRPDDALLTTGQAALILGSSRQHVVNLCSRGLLPFVTVRSHRRIRRGDLESLQTRTLAMTRDQRRSLWLSHAIAGRIVANPAQALELARLNLHTMQSASNRGAGNKWLREWQALLAGPLEGLLSSLTSDTPFSRELRQNSPFAGILDDSERQQILDAFVKNSVEGSNA